MNKHLIGLAAIYGVTVGDLTEEELGTKIIELAKADKTSITGLTSDKEKLEGEKTQLTTDLATEKEAKNKLENDDDMVKLKANGVIAESVITDLRTEGKRLYNLIAGDTPDASIIATLESTDHTSLKALVKGYTTQFEEKFPAKCHDCESENVSRQTSVKPNDSSLEDGPHNKPPVGPKSNSDVANSIALEKKDSFKLHEANKKKSE